MMILTEEKLEVSNPTSDSMLIYIEKPVVVKNIKNKKKYYQLGKIVDKTGAKDVEKYFYTDGEKFYIRDVGQFKEKFEKGGNTDGDDS